MNNTHPSIHQRKQSAFTLSEVLIALALLGIVAAFAIPKVLQSQGDAKRKALVKETYAAFSDAVYEGVLNGRLSNAVGVTQRRQYYKEKLNAVKTCDNSEVEGCWSHGLDTNSGNPGFAVLSWKDKPGMILPNGATVTGLDEADNNGHHWIIFDYNGAAGPNKQGEDQFFLVAVYDQNSEGVKSGKVMIGGLCGTSTESFRCSYVSRDALRQLLN